MQVKELVLRLISPYNNNNNNNNNNNYYYYYLKFGWHPVAGAILPITLYMYVLWRLAGDVSTDTYVRTGLYTKRASHCYPNLSVGEMDWQHAINPHSNECRENSFSGYRMVKRWHTGTQTEMGQLICIIPQAETAPKKDCERVMASEKGYNIVRERQDIVLYCRVLSIRNWSLRNCKTVNIIASEDRKQ
jgi:hypothetical protein